MQSIQLTRRRFLAGLGTLAVAGALPGKALASTGHQRALSFLNLHTGERASGTYWQAGAYQQEVLDGFNQVLKCHRSGEVTNMDKGLFDQLSQLTQTLGYQGEIQIISGYRSPAANAAMKKAGRNVATRSFHTLGRAIDVRLPGMNLAKVHKAALAMKAGGVGYYPGDNFIHLDTGRVRRW
ncbi:DUF882 domain-containing protein [Gallaecimonas sp. GXIMD4217]|uniref:DUF882 domain-containing protein n=1 Tax=Gallaecimonas sp. GXIMD4217 TaxID=3131927 RepID=UPI00311B00E2